MPEFCYNKVRFGIIPAGQRRWRLEPKHLLFPAEITRHYLVLVHGQNIKKKKGKKNLEKIKLRVEQSGVAVSH